MPISFNSINPLSLFTLTSEPASMILAQPCGLNIQDAIRYGKTEVIKALTPASDVNRPLPNGEMPLHFAVRSNQLEIVSALLAKGANPEIQDFQNLSAIDHAILQKNQPIFISILAEKIGANAEEVKQQLQNSNTSHATQFLKSMNELTTVDVKKLSPACQAAYKGDLHALSKAAIHKADSKGLLPIHYAILGKRDDAVDKLLELGVDRKILANRNSLLHFAAMSGSQAMVNKFKDLDPNGKNATGATPLHYAAAKQHLQLVEALVKAGANPTVLDDQKMSPFFLFGATTYQRDPLALSKGQAILFASTVISYASLMAYNAGFVSSNSAKIATLAVMTGSTLVANWSEWAIFFSSLDRPWKKGVALAGAGIAFIPPLNVGYQAWKTYHIVRNAFDGVKKCWHNVGYRNWTVARNTLVYSVNTAQSSLRLYKQAKFTYEIFLNAVYVYKMWAAQDNEDAFFEAYADYLRFLKQRYNIHDEVLNPADCVDVDPEKLMHLSHEDRLRYSDLKPECPEHALLMLNPNFTMDDLSEKGLSLFKGTFRTLQRQFHPDKAGPGSEEVAVRLNAASDTLTKWVQQNS